MQIVRVATARGWVVLGSDTAHFYANLEPGRPFPILDDLPAYVEAQRTALRLASSPQHFIPGHDPLVLARYPSCESGTRRRRAARSRTRGREGRPHDRDESGSREPLGFIGVGRMGGPMAERLLRGGTSGYGS